MRSASINEIKQELAGEKNSRLIELCLRLARFKKENKELLTYLLFEAADEEGYIKSTKQEIETLFTTINISHLYFAKKTLRKIGRLINKYSRYSGSKQTDIELRIFFCEQLKSSGIPIQRNAVINNIYQGQIKKIMTQLTTLHEDLQHDYKRMMVPLVEENGTGKWTLFKRRK
jgi:hypothetical protein